MKEFFGLGGAKKEAEVRGEVEAEALMEVDAFQAPAPAAPMQSSAVGFGGAQPDLFDLLLTQRANGSFTALVDAYIPPAGANGKAVTA